MGITGSRGKKVAPVSVTEGDPSAQALKCQTSSVGVTQKNTLKDRLGNRLFSMDDRILAEEVDRILEECENTKDTKKSFPESPLSMCENYAFCCNRRDRRDTDTKSRRSADILPTDLLKLGRFEDKKDICTCNNINKPQKQVIFKLFLQVKFSGFH